MRFWITRDIAKMRRHTTFVASLEHDVHIGKRDKKKGRFRWQGKRAYYSSFADFMRVIKGNAPGNWDYADHFRRHPAPDWLIRRLEEPVGYRLEFDYEYDNVTDSELLKEVLQKADWVEA